MSYILYKSIIDNINEIITVSFKITSSDEFVDFCNNIINNLEYIFNIKFYSIEYNGTHCKIYTKIKNKGWITNEYMKVLVYEFILLPVNNTYSIKDDVENNKIKKVTKEIETQTEDKEIVLIKQYNLIEEINKVLNDLFT